MLVCSRPDSLPVSSCAPVEQVNIRRYNTVCGPGQCEWQEQAAGRLQNWQLQNTPDPQLVEVGGPCLHPHFYACAAAVSNGAHAMAQIEGIAAMSIYLGSSASSSELVNALDCFCQPWGRHLRDCGPMSLDESEELSLVPGPRGQHLREEFMLNGRNPADPPLETISEWKQT